MHKNNIRLYRPQVNLAQTTTFRMWMVSLCALLAVFQSSLRDSFSSMILAGSAVFAAVVTETLIYLRTERSGSVKDGSAIASALVLSLLLPNQLHPIYAVMGAVFAMIVVKHSFGGLGANWLNPAVGGWLFIRFSRPEAFNRALANSPLTPINEGMLRGISNPENSPLGLLGVMGRDYGTLSNYPLDNFLKAVLDEGLFAFAGLEFPKSYIEFFNASATGIIADRGILALLVGTIIVAAGMAKRAWIPAVYIMVYMLLVRLFGALPFGGDLGEGDLFFGIFSGGIIVSAFLLSCDPSTGTKSDIGVLITAVLGGVLGFVFRYIGAEVYGAIFAVAFINMIVPLIRSFESKGLYKNRTYGEKAT